jgi:hypothetical protein
MNLYFYYQTLTKLFLNSATELIEELIRRLRVKEARVFRTYKITPFLTLLMTPRLRTLDLTLIFESAGNDISDILHLASIRSLVKEERVSRLRYIIKQIFFLFQNLETLLLDITTRRYVGDFYFIPKFRKLRILDISFCQAGDDCLNLIGKHCLELRY